MKLTTFLIAAMATLTMATPMASPKDTPADAADAIFARDDDCKKCEDYFDHCRAVSLRAVSARAIADLQQSWWCFVNPAGCQKIGRAHV